MGLKFNPLLNNGFDFTGTGGGGGGVTSVNGISGAVTLAAGSGITLTPSGSTITIASTGGGSGANQTLSNLTSPTAINQALLPGVANLDIGIVGQSWRNLYVTNINDNGGTGSVQIFARQLSASTGNTSLDWSNRQLVGTNGSTIMLDWSGSVLNASTHKITNVVDPTSAQDAATKAYVDSVASVTTFNKENITLSSTNITNQFVDLAHLTKANSLFMSITKAAQVEGDDYILSTVGGVTRLTFNNDLATGGVSALVAGNILNIQYSF